MNKKLKYLLVVSFFLFVAMFIFFTFIDLYKQKRIETILDIHTNKIQTYYNILSHNQKVTADIIYDETMENEKLIAVLQKANIAKKNNNIQKLNELRSKALNLVKNKYHHYKKTGVLQYHFVFPDNVSFLRMHKVSKFGDDLTKVRTDFDYSNRSLKQVRGFTQGRTAHAFRNVYPIVDKTNTHLGAFEVSFSSELLQNYFTKVNKIHTHFLVRKDIFQSHTWKRDDLVLKYHPSSEHENYMITMTQDHTMQQCVIENKKRIIPNKKQIDKMIKKGEKFSVYSIYKNKARVASFYPILQTMTKEPVAWIVSYVHEPLIDKTIETSIVAYIFIAVVLLIIFIFIYLQLIHKEVLKDIVDEKTNHLFKVNRELEESEHELQIINENLEHKIEQEVEKSRKKDKVLFEQTKMAALGEMIGNIAHQWRQPLSVISTSASGMNLQSQMDLLTKDKIKEYTEAINDNAQYLSKTIDDFRNFIRGSSKKEKFDIQNAIDSFLNLVATSLKKYEIQVDLNIPKGLIVNSLRNELHQCLINIFNNSKDAMIQRGVENKVVQINVSKTNTHLQIDFHDNGKGIDESIIDKIFEPYFTTKHQSIGTGLGLNMTYKLITESMGGTISVSNESFCVEKNNYYGAVFSISIPLE